MIQAFLLAALLWIAPPALADGKARPQPDAETFLTQARARWQELVTQSPPSVSAAGFLPIRELIRGQDEISVDNMLAKLREKEAAHDVEWDPQTGRWKLLHDQGRSSVPLNDPINVVKGPQGYLVTDGHHDLFLALYLGASTIAVHVQEDLSQLSPKEFWEKVIQRDWVLLKRSPDSLAIDPPEMSEISDNPNRYLASLLALKVEARTHPETSDSVNPADPVEIKKIKGPAVPVWMKVNDGIPFVEFYLARALSEAGITYNPAWGATVPPGQIEIARAALLKARQTESIPQLKRIPIFENSTSAAEARQGKGPLKDLIRRFSIKWPTSAECASVFSH